MVTALHFVIVFGYTALSACLPGAVAEVKLRVRYLDGRGVLRLVMAACTSAGWTVSGLAADDVVDDETGPRTVAVTLELIGAHPREALMTRLVDIDGVLGVEVLSDEFTE